MTYFLKYDYTIIRRHWILLLFRYLKLIIFLVWAFVLYYFSLKFNDKIWGDINHYLIFPLIFVLINYAFIKLILWYIKFYNDLLVIYNWHLIVIKSSLISMDNIEFIDINKITKLDTYCNWIVPNFMWFGNLVAEQQRDELRTFHFVPKPFKALQILNEEKQKVLDDMKKGYIVNNIEEK
jgi:hypothetical protein